MCGYAEVGQRGGWWRGGLVVVSGLVVVVSSGEGGVCGEGGVRGEGGGVPCATTTTAPESQQGPLRVHRDRLKVRVVMVMVVVSSP